jgi:hypothetical protein
VEEGIKRELMEGDKAEEAKRKLSRAAGKSLRASSKEECDTESDNNGKPAANIPAVAASPA